MKANRLLILENSLIKKEQLLNNKFEQHFADVKRANGQPLNDKLNGRSTMDRWERQNEAIRTLKDGIEKTKRAIEIEKDKIFETSKVKENLPTFILELIDDGTLIQWRKHPKKFFVKGVEKARLEWFPKEGIVQHQYVSEIPKGTGQFDIFKNVFNDLRKKILTEVET